MKEVLEILYDQSAIGYLATVDGGKPRVRPWGFMFEENGRLYFCTAGNKKVYQQLLAVPYVEYSKTTREMVWVRVSGEIHWDDSMPVREKIFERASMLKQFYQTPDNPIFKVFYLEHGQATIDSFTSDRQKTFEF